MVSLLFLHTVSSAGAAKLTTCAVPPAVLGCIQANPLEKYNQPCSESLRAMPTTQNFLRTTSGWRRTREERQTMSAALKHAQRLTRMTKIWGGKKVPTDESHWFTKSEISEWRKTGHCWSSTGATGKRLSWATIPEGKAHHKWAQAAAGWHLLSNHSLQISLRLYSLTNY